MPLHECASPLDKASKNCSTSLGTPLEVRFIECTCVVEQVSWLQLLLPWRYPQVSWHAYQLEAMVKWHASMQPNFFVPCSFRSSSKHIHAECKYCIAVYTKHNSMIYVNLVAAFVPPHSCITIIIVIAILWQKRFGPITPSPASRTCIWSWQHT